MMTEEQWPWPLVKETGMAEELNLAPIKKRCTIAQEACNAGKPVGGALIYHAYLSDVRNLLVEVERLRNVVQVMHSKVVHARSWANWHREENPFTLNPSDYPRIEEKASDGWSGVTGLFVEAKGVDKT